MPQSKPQSRPKFIPGIDVSHWQGKIDWQKVRDSEQEPASVRIMGKRFAFIKATEGASFVDPSFRDNWRMAKQAEVLRGAYHYFEPALINLQEFDEQRELLLLDNAQHQARLFLKTVEMEDGDLPPALQLEISRGLTDVELRRCVQVWLDEVELATHRRVIIYAGVAFLQNFFPGWLAAPGRAPRPLWIADTFQPGPQGPPLPPDQGHWDFWQYSVTGYVDGVLVNANLDWFNGSLQALEKLAHLKIEPLYQRKTAARAPAQAPVQMKVHIVRRGETLDSIAEKYDVTVADLIRANLIDNPHMIPIGAQLNIP